jgi:non-homologous end joining protein Ku
MFLATSEREKISFHRLHKQTGSRIRAVEIESKR